MTENGEGKNKKNGQLSSTAEERAAAVMVAADEAVIALSTKRRHSGAGMIRLDAGRIAANGGTSAANLDPFAGYMKVLGHNRLKYYFQSRVTGQIVPLHPREITIHTLPSIEDMKWWREHFPTERHPFVDVDTIRGRLMELCHQVGIYRPELVRGRGIWWDETEGGVVHDGEWVSFAGKSFPPWDAPGPWVYERESAWTGLIGTALDDDEGRFLLTQLERLAWRLPGSGMDSVGILARLVAGWLVVAPVAGALRWRPNLNISGPAGAGKSYFARQVCVPLLGPTALHVEGETTEAGLRQALARDARAIVWDEGEGEGSAGQARLRQAMALARRLSSGGHGGGVVKGTTGHQAKRFDGIAVMLVLSIFGIPLDRDSDEGRWTMVELALARQRGAIALPADYGARLRGRTVQLLACLRQTHETFARVGERLWGSRRAGDQLGALLAGAHVLTSSEPISSEDAAAQLVELPAQLRGGVQQSDEARCLARLTSWCVRVDTHSGRRQVTRSIGELVSQVLAGGGEDEISLVEAKRVLRRHGIAMTRSGVAVAKRHDQLTGVFQGSDFSGGYARMLERLDGAAPTKNAVRFGPGVQVLAVELPAALFETDLANARYAADQD